MKRNFEISLEYNRTDILNKLLVLIFDVKVVNFSEQKVDKNALKEEILKKIPKGEEKFFYLRSYNNKNASFIFEINKWFDSKNKLVETENRYVKRLILNRLPTLITNNVNAVDYTKVIEASFRNYDGNLNAMKIEVKEQFRHNIMTVLKSKNNPRKELKKMDFDSSVETYLKFMKKK